jgi:hypothetical protein
MATKEQMEEVQKSLQMLLQQNEKMSDKIKALETENRAIKKGADDTKTRIDQNLAKWKDLNNQAEGLFTEMTEVLVRLDEDAVNSSFIQERTVKLSDFTQLVAVFDTEDTTAHSVKQEVKEETPPVGGPFDSVGREEKIDMFFGRDGDYTALSMRRFIERYKVVKELNVRSRLRGWDSASYRAAKLKLCLMGDAFDYVSFASSICEEWTENDSTIIEKLREKFTNLNAVELNILEFEKSLQEPKESISDYLSRLRRSVKDAYDGDSQRELDRKVAWKFVSGINDEKVRRKLLEGGWMKTRQEAKPLEDLLKVAEIAKKTDDAARALGKSCNVGMAQLQEYGTVSAWDRYGDRSKKSSNESSSSRSSGSSGRTGGSYSSSELPLEFLECFYCKRKHRGGWFHCSLRRKENPKWKPQRRGTTATPSDKSSSAATDFRKAPLPTK